MRRRHTRAGATLVGLLVRAPSGTWSALHQVGTAELNPTRPLCILDEVANQVYVFYSPNQSAIYYKASDMNTIAFPGGSGTPFMARDVVADINNPTGTKQNIDVKTKGLVVVGSSSSRMTYWHNAFAPMP